MSREQTSKERSAAYVEALKQEMRGYEQKVAGAKLRKDAGTAAVYEARIEAVKAEIARAKRQGQTPTSKDEVEADAPPEEEQEEATK